ncbi:MAG: lysozyme family protein [Lachnospiraceae bacterium]|nr:lysozyme family protein [Lachnospiraceae bacterium]
MKKRTDNKTAGRTGRKTKRGRDGNQIRKLNLLLMLAAAIGLLLFAARFILQRQTIRIHSDPTYLSDSVLEYSDTVDFYAEKNGIAEYSDYLLAIMQVETGGRGDYVMQSSESLGLPPGSLEPEDSIAQGCSYFAEILGEAEKKGCDLDAAIQAYNFGIDYLDFAAKRGGDSDLDMATEFAEWKSGGETTEYRSELASEVNGGWRYKYGNMFYAELVKKIVENLKE